MKRHKFIFLSLILLFSRCIGIDYIDDPVLGTIEISGLANNQLFVNASATLTATYFDGQGVEQSATFNWISSDTDVAIIDGNGKVTALKVGSAQIGVSANGVQKSFNLSVVENTDIASVVIAAPKRGVLKGQNLMLQVKAITVGGQEVSNISANWLSSQTSVATVSSTGQVNGIAKGQTKIKAIYNGLESAEFLVSVVENETDLAEIIVQLPDDALRLNEEMQLLAIAKNINGGEIQGQNFNWVSNNPAILTINSSGLAEGLAEGKVNIKVLINDFESPTYEVTVANPDKITRLSINSPQNTLTVGEQIQLSVKAFNLFDEEIQAQNITWQSSSATVISINSNGLANGVGVGTAQITAQHNGITSNLLNIAVSAAQVTQRTGTFSGANGYSVSGMATLVQNNNNTLTLQFSSNFQSQNGPGLYVYLSNQANSVGGGVELGKLKATSGSQTYDVPSNVQLNTYTYVLVFCKPFSVPFGRAQFN